MSNTLTGTVLKVLDAETGTGAKGTWTKQPFVIETKDQYPKKVAFEAWGKSSESASNLIEGQQITVHFNAESREWNNKWFTSLSVWKIEIESSGPAKKGDSLNVPVNNTGEEEDSLPF